MVLLNPVIRQEHYPILEVKEENAFSDLPEDIHTLIKNLSDSNLQVNNQFHEQEFQVREQESQVHEQEFQVHEQEFQEFQVYEQNSIAVNPNEYSIDIADNNQDLILFQNRKKEIFDLLDETKNILDKNVANPNKWLDSIEKNFEPLRKLVKDCKQFERKNHIPNTWKDRNNNTFWL
ncbi:27132_t:CDS:2 [Dentiscutata erythropus]|uniref:27132_t:CDS:1 n=1 Tax=Dentiscutata erythropus TaxID=1348616 RepID=A0A9N9G5W3_9GLOM|nr:27132_t:CDS:2 [Dentiscutata erythropus]